MSNFLANLLELTLDAAPWLLLGLVIGGLIKRLMPARLLERHLKGEGFLPVVKAALIGAPLPLCSCGVIPAALGLRRAGASKSSTVSFLVSTPETGVDSISVTYAMLGPVMAIVRPVAAVISAITAGCCADSRCSIAAIKPRTGAAASIRCSSTSRPVCRSRSSTSSTLRSSIRLRMSGVSCMYLKRCWRRPRVPAGSVLPCRTGSPRQPG